MLTSTGIGSGLDIESLVTQLVAAERAPTEGRIQRQEAALASQLSSLGVFQGSLASLRDSISSLNDDSLFDSKIVFSSDTASLFGQITGEPDVAKFDLSVEQLAQSHSLASEAFASVDEEVGEGSLTIRFGSTDYVGPDPGPESYNGFVENTELSSLTLDLEAGNNSLEQLRDSINEANAGVTAALVNDGQGYRLVLTSSATGEASSMEIVVTDSGDSDDTDASGLSRLAFSAAATHMEQTRQGLDAQVSLNGLALSSSTNTLDEAIEGISITLSKTTESPVSLTISENSGALIQRVSTFISDYNTYIGTVEQVAGYNADLLQGGVLQGDFTVRSITNQLKSFISSAVPGATGTYQYLSQVGIKTNESGQLELDTGIFQDALDEDASSVAALFSNRVETSDPNIQPISTSSASAVNGSWPVTITQVPTSAEYLGAFISFPLTVDSDNDEFSIEVDGTASDPIQLIQGSYSSGDEFVTMMLSAIQTDTNLSSAGKIPELVFNSTDNRLEIRSSDWGSQTSIEILSTDLNSASGLGLSVGEGTPGVDVAGQIGTWSVTGSGRVLTAAQGTEVEGLSIEVDGGSIGDRGELSFHQGIAGLIEQMADRYLIDDGALSQRSEGIIDRLDDLLEQREVLDRRMDSVESRYRDQFNALDGLLAQLQNTSNFLSQQLDSLPGPRKTNE